MDPESRVCISFARLWEDGTWDMEDITLPAGFLRDDCDDCGAVRWYRENRLTIPELRDVVQVVVMGWS